MDISECIINAAGEREYNCLYNYEITKNTIEDEQFIIEGHFCKPNMMSDSLRRRLVQYGVPQNKLNRFLKGDDSE
jgi:pilus assembly protein CpaF